LRKKQQFSHGRSDLALKARDVAEFFKELTPEVYTRETCDGFKFGDPEKSVKKVAVTWMATMGVLHEALRRGVDMVVTHEPTFYNHWDETANLADDTVYKVKKELLEEHNIPIYRVHDGWDFYPEYGILDSLAKALGLDRVVGETTKIRVYKSRIISLHDLAKKVKADLGLKGLRYVGDPDQDITRIGLGVGSLGMLNNLKDAMQLGADCLICGETVEWQAARYSEDSSVALMPIGHSNSENPGMKSLSEFLKKEIPELEIEYIETPDPFVLYK